MSYVVRGAQSEDLQSLSELIVHTPVGMDNLPRDLGELELLLNHSVSLFHRKKTSPTKEMYLFVLEHIPTQKVIGMCGIWAKTGVMHPSLFYKIEEEIRNYGFLEYLRLIKHREGPTEICSLYLVPEHRHEGLGKLLSFSRFLFMAAFPDRFTKEIIAVIQGICDESGQSPFWEAVGRHFLDIDFSTLKERMLKNSSFLPSILPSFPLYVTLLPLAAQAVLGKSHPASLPAYNLLIREGFVFSGEIDILDAGPRLSAPLEEIHTVKYSRLAIISKYEKIEHSGSYLVSNETLEFRCCLSTLALFPNGEVALPESTCEALKLNIGQPIRYLSLTSGVK